MKKTKAVKAGASEPRACSGEPVKPVDAGGMMILDLIPKDLATVTEADVKRVVRIQEPKKGDDRQLGLVHHTDTRRMLALAARYFYQSRTVQLRAFGEAENEEEAREFRQQSDWLVTLCDLAKDIFWADVRLDIGGGARSAKHLRVREGWIVVEEKREADNPGAMGVSSGDDAMIAVRAALAKARGEK